MQFQHYKPNRRTISRPHGVRLQGTKMTSNANSHPPTDSPDQWRAEDYQQIVNGANIGVIVMRPDFTVTLWNRFMEDAYLVPAAEVVGRKLHEVFPPIAMDGRLDEMATIVNEGRPAERLVHHPSRHRGWREIRVRAVPLTGEGGQVRGITLYLHDVTEQNRQRRELEQQQESLESLINSEHVLVTAHDADGIVHIWNRCAEKLLGYSREEIIGQPFPLEQLIPDENTRRSLLEALNNGAPVHDLETVMCTKQGECKMLAWSVIPRLDQDGAVGHFSIGFDITALRELDIQRKQEETRLFSILNNLPAAVLLEDASGSVQFFNDAARSMLGTLAPRHWRKAFRWNTQQPGTRSTLASQAGPTRNAPNTTDVQGEDGAWYSVTVIHLDPPADLAARLIVVHDITEQKQSEAATRKLAKLTDTVTDGIVAVAADLTITSWNAGAQRIFGYTAAETIGRPVSMLGVTQAGIDRLLHTIAEKGEFVAEPRMKRKDGSVADLVLSVSLLKEEGEERSGYLAFMKDITELRKAQRHLERSQKIQSIGTLAGGIAHTFNNIFGAIIGYAGYVRKELPPDSDAVGDIDIIVKSAQEAATLVRHLSSFARGGCARFEIVDTAGVINDTLDILTHTLEGGIGLDAKIEQGLWPVSADRTQIQQVIVNACANSCNAMPGGGSITITAANVELTPEAARRLNAPADGPYVELVISDTGCGMSADVLERAIEPFYSTKGAAGLGLSAAYGIIRSHGGFMHFDSEPDKGTLLKVYLPAARQEPLQTQPRTQRVEFDGATVLVIEDESSLQSILARMLDDLRCRAVVAATAAEAVELYAREYAGIDIVLLDMILPDGTGNDVYAELKKINPSVRAIISSGYSADASSLLAAEDGVVDYLEKPYGMKHLAEALQRALHPPSKPTCERDDS